MFITLTYRDRDLPWDGSLDQEAITLFIRRLRKRTGKKIRYFGCGEYGDKTSRPHYHLIVWGHWFPDAEFHAMSPAGHRLYLSRHLERLWPYGMSNFGEVTYQSAAYTARYIMKKFIGPDSDQHYMTDLEKLDQETGELTPIIKTPEYIRMSKRPGIGYEWITRYYKDVYPSDFIIHDGKKHPVPKYYDKIYEAIDPDGMARVREAREQFAEEHAEDSTRSRLDDREFCKSVQLEQLKREIDHHETESIRSSRQRSRGIPTAVFPAHGRHRKKDIR